MYYRWEFPRIVSQAHFLSRSEFSLYLMDELQSVLLTAKYIMDSAILKAGPEDNTSHYGGILIRGLTARLLCYKFANIYSLVSVGVQNTGTGIHPISFLSANLKKKNY